MIKPILFFVPGMIALSLFFTGVLERAPSCAWGGEAGEVQTLTLELAKKIASNAEAFAKKKNWKVSIAIVNSEGTLAYFQRDTDAYLGSVEVAIQKARSANAFRRPTSSFVDGVKQGRLGLLTVKDVVVMEGGVPIVVGGKHLGAIGVSGAKSTEDEEAAKAGVDGK